MSNISPNFSLSNRFSNFFRFLYQLRFTCPPSRPEVAKQRHNITSFFSLSNQLSNFFDFLSARLAASSISAQEAQNRDIIYQQFLLCQAKICFFRFFSASRGRTRVHILFFLRRTATEQGASFRKRTYLHEQSRCTKDADGTINSAVFSPLPHQP